MGRERTYNRRFLTVWLTTVLTGLTLSLPVLLQGAVEARSSEKPSSTTFTQTSNSGPAEQGESPQVPSSTPGENENCSGGTLQDSHRGLSELLMESPQNVRSHSLQKTKNVPNLKPANNSNVTDQTDFSDHLSQKTDIKDQNSQEAPRQVFHSSPQDAVNLKHLPLQEEQNGSSPCKPEDNSNRVSVSGESSSTIGNETMISGQLGEVPEQIVYWKPREVLSEDYDYSSDPVTDSDALLKLLNPFILKEIAFTKTLFFCEYIYSAMYGHYSSDLTDTLISYKNSLLSLVADEKFTQVCLVFYRDFNSACEERTLLTLCPDEAIAFLHPNDCTRPSTEDLYFHQLQASTLLEGDEACFQAVCNGSVRVIDWTADGDFVRFVRSDVVLENGTSCKSYFSEYYQQGLNGTSWVSNRHWPSCYPGFDIVWINDPETSSGDSAWSHLPSHCQASEGSLVTVVLCIVVSGILGNLLVVVVMAKSQRGDPSSMLRLSLALADLLQCLFVLVPSLNAHITVINSREVDGGLPSDKTEPTTSQHQNSDHGLVVVDDGFPIFSAVVMTTCCVTSLMNLFALSLERFLITYNTAQHKSFFTKPRTITFTLVTWMLGLATSLTLQYDSEGNTLVTFWSSFNKLPVGVSPTGMKTVLPVVVAVLGLVCLCTGVLSVVAVVRFLVAEAKKAAERNQPDRTDMEDQQEKPIRVAARVSVMTLLYFASVIPGGAACVLHLLDVRFPRTELVLYLCWWLHLAHVAWNPWLYNLPSQQFRGDAANMLTRLVPQHVLQHCHLQRKSGERRREETHITTVDQDTELAVLRKTKRRHRTVIPGVRWT